MTCLTYEILYESTKRGGARVGETRGARVGETRGARVGETRPRHNSPRRRAGGVGLLGSDAVVDAAAMWGN